METSKHKKCNEKYLLRNILFILLGLSLVTLVSFNILLRSKNYPSDNRLLQTNRFRIDESAQPIDLLASGISNLPEANPYKFLNTGLAYKILSALDTFEPVPVEYLVYSKKPRDSYHIPFHGLKNDHQYCEKHRAIFVEYPETIFEQKNFMIEGRQPVIREIVIPQMGTNVMPYIWPNMSKAEKGRPFFDLDPRVNVYFTVNAMHANKHVGRDFACLSQEVNHIPGHYSLNRKDTIAEEAIKYAMKFQDRPHCFDYDKYFPRTWLLYEKESCQDFFKGLKQPEHKKLREERKIVYIHKKAVNSHRGLGVTPLDANKEEQLIKEYKNGDLCGKISKVSIVQNYIHNPLLLEGRKFDFRMYLVIASSNPLMAYYHDGFLRVSLYDYDVDVSDKKVLMTNLALNNAIYKDAKNGKLHHGMTEEELKLAQQWSFDRLEDYLLNAGVIRDPNWLDNYLRPEFKKAMIHLVRMSSHTFLQRSSLYELYGVDFMLDTDLTLWFIEANSGPALDGYSEPMEKFIAKMLKDHFEIVFSLLKSRMKRVVLLVNKIINQGQAIETENGDVEINNFKQWKDEFDRVSKNYFEKEFELAPDNGFSKIIDNNSEGRDRYMGFLDENCLQY